MKKQNAGINNFRLIAASMVVAIHCYPFQTISKELNTLVTLTVFRIAVPFFFMVSGYYLLGPIMNSDINTSQINAYIKKQLKVYIFAIVLYLPLAFYSQTITLNISIISFIKQLFISGFFTIFGFSLPGY